MIPKQIFLLTLILIVLGAALILLNTEAKTVPASDLPEYHEPSKQLPNPYDPEEVRAI